MRKIYIIEFHSENPQVETFEFNTFLPAEIHKDLNRFAWELGIKISIEDISNAEKFAEEYYKRKGYTVVRCYPSGYNIRDTPMINNYPEYYDGKDYDGSSDFMKLLKKHNIPLKLMQKVGVPDFFCYDSYKDDWFFVEVKTFKDGLNLNQVKWIVENKLRTKIVFVDDENSPNLKELKEDIKRENPPNNKSILDIVHNLKTETKDGIF